MNWDKFEKIKIIQQLASSDEEVLDSALDKVIDNPDPDFLHPLVNIFSESMSILQKKEEAITLVKGVMPVTQREGAIAEDLRKYSPVEIRVDFSKIQTSKDKRNQDSGFRKNLRDRFKTGIFSNEAPKNEIGSKDKKNAIEMPDKNNNVSYQSHEFDDFEEFDDLKLYEEKDQTKLSEDELSKDELDISNNDHSKDLYDFDELEKNIPKDQKENTEELFQKAIIKEPKIDDIKIEKNERSFVNKAKYNLSEPVRVASDLLWIEKLFEMAVNEGASDIHISPDEIPYFRIQGELKRIANGDAVKKEVLEKALFSLINDTEIEKLHNEKELDFSIKLENHSIRLRGNYYYDLNGLSAVFRLIPTKILSAHELNIDSGILEFCNYSKGMVLVTGPTGSGKSTTLAAMIDWINKNRSSHILTIEDPVEFIHLPDKSRITHREVKKNTNSFSSALKSALRQDPDVILIGELRDTESIEIALQAAETGHLVFGTLHTRTAPQTIDRIIHVFDAGRQEQIRTMLAESIIGVVSQVLIRSSQTGKRVVAQEIMKTNPAISNMIRKNAIFQIYDVMRTGNKIGMRSLFQSITRLVETGSIKPEDAYEHCTTPEEREELENMRFS